MPKLLYILLICLPGFLFAQGIKKILKEDPNSFTNELYYVLKSDKGVKHGKYYKVSTDYIILVNGNYKKGLKDSVWLTYYRSGQMMSKGAYLNDIRTGVWEFYNKEGALEVKYDFTTKELLFYEQPGQEKAYPYKVVNGDASFHALLDRPPVYIEGNPAMNYTIVTNIRYPRAAFSNNASGRVLVSFVVDSAGRAIDHKVVKKVGSGLDEEALRVVKLVSDNWIPGRLNGKQVNIELVVPVSFSLEK